MSSFELRPETTYQAVVGQVIVKFRKKMRVDQSLMASSLGVTQSTWSRIERGDSALSVGQLAKAADYLRVKSSTILYEVESAVDELKRQGVIVRNIAAKDSKNKNAVAMIGAAALGAFVGAAIAKSNDSKT